MNYKAFYIITGFTNEEQALFENFLKSPYFNTRKKPLELFRIIRKIRTKSESQVSKEKIFEKLYPSKKFNANTFNDLMAQLHKLAEDFLITETNKKEKVKNNVLLMEKFLEGRFKNLFESKKKQTDKILEGERLNEFFFLHSYLKDAYHINYLQTYKDNKTSKEKDIITKLLYSCITNALNFAQEETMAIFVQAVTRKGELSDTKCSDFIAGVTTKMFDEEFLNLLKPYNKHYSNSELLKKLLNIQLDYNTPELYFDYKKAVRKNRAVLTQDQITFHYAYLIGYAQGKTSLNTNDKIFNKEIDSLYREILKNKYYTSVKVNFFRPKLYGSFLNSFLGGKNTGAIRHMIDNCIPLLEKRYVSFYKNLSLSYISYLSGDYRTALELIKDVNIHYSTNLYAFKNYHLKLHFLLGDTEQTLNLADSYIKYLNSNGKKDKRNYFRRLNFVKNIKKITIAKNRRDSEELKYLLKQILDEPLIMQRDWLIETLEKIINMKNL